jgi:hypothetical protein
MPHQIALFVTVFWTIFYILLWFFVGDWRILLLTILTPVIALTVWLCTREQITDEQILEDCSAAVKHLHDGGGGGGGG